MKLIKMLITSGLVVQNRASFRGFPSNRERARTVDRPGNNGQDNFNTSKKYPEEIIKPGVVFPSQVAYRNIFGKSTTADERLYFMQHGVFQNALSQRGKGSKLRRQPYKNRFTQNTMMDLMESVALENYRVIDRSKPIEYGLDYTGMSAAGYRDPEVIPSEGSVQGPVVGGSEYILGNQNTPDASMASERSSFSDQPLATGFYNTYPAKDTVLANALGNILVGTPTEQDHFIGRATDMGLTASPTGPPIVPTSDEPMDGTLPMDETPPPPPPPPQVNTIIKEKKKKAKELVLPKRSGFDASDLINAKSKLKTSTRNEERRVEEKKTAPNIMDDLAARLKARRQSQEGEDDNNDEDELFE